jgi:hypothetical protein
MEEEMDANQPQSIEVQEAERDPEMTTLRVSTFTSY